MYSGTYLTKLNLLIQVILQATKSSNAIVASVMDMLQLYGSTQYGPGFGQAGSSRSDGNIFKENRSIKVIKQKLKPKKRQFTTKSLKKLWHTFALKKKIIPKSFQ